MCTVQIKCRWLRSNDRTYCSVGRGVILPIMVQGLRLPLRLFGHRGRSTLRKSTLVHTLGQGTGCAGYGVHKGVVAPRASMDVPAT